VHSFDVILRSIAAVARQLKHFCLVLDGQYKYIKKYCQYVAVTQVVHIISEIQEQLLLEKIYNKPCLSAWIFYKINLNSEWSNIIHCNRSAYN